MTFLKHKFILTPFHLQIDFQIKTQVLISLMMIMINNKIFTYMILFYYRIIYHIDNDMIC